jgi:hypothetical protein
MAKTVRMTRKTRQQQINALLAQDINHAFLTYVRIGQWRVWGVRTSRQLLFNNDIKHRYLVEHLLACKCTRKLDGGR